ncbi:uncharacterized protein MELLADRAFT_67952 [Melampsora larici-populina 98AG31]|uniref:Secreted protein n=1 Tax=Melampsora larici-populina (strain 98AG31 / pathotype 3-4-7) TaxID=747676 RepID=F4S520_MELLP|nr:uncharacterized protein MELLADRAFT_67952 [Melampsora larici-populina 98AG31]EGG00240.1 hypothetical protein MELLADRAFT_67952 [Melampsora larici-populina 98AG31]
MSGRAWFVKLFMFLALKHWSSYVCAGSQLEAKILDDWGCTPETHSWTKLNPSEDFLVTEFSAHNMGDLEQLLGKQIGQGVSQSFDDLGKTNHGTPSTHKISSIDIMNHTPLMEYIPDITFASPSIPAINTKGGHSLREVTSENMWEYNHEIPTYDSFSPQEADIFDYTQSMNEYYQHHESIRNKDDYQQSEKHSFLPPGVTNDTQELLGCNLKTNHIPNGKDQLSKITSLERLPNQQNELPDSKKKNVLKPIVSREKISREKSISNISRKRRQQKYELEAHGVFVQTRIDAVKRYRLKRRRRELGITPVFNEKHINLTSDKEKLLAPMSDASVARQNEPVDFTGTNNEQRISITDQTMAIKEKCGPASSKDVQSNVGKKIYGLLHKIGMLNVNRSPSLCYEIYEFFLDIYKGIKGVEQFDAKDVRSVRRAIKNAAYAVVMTFLGILRVFEAGQNEENDTERTLKDGWNFMKGFYSTWKDATLEQFHFGKVTQFDQGHSLNPEFHLRYLKDIQNRAAVSYSMILSISLLWSKDRGHSKVPTDMWNQYKTVQTTWYTDCKTDQGGIYTRRGIRNYSFWGPEQFERDNWHLNGKENLSPNHIWEFGSNAAQFHTDVGREVCKDLHVFFEDLIHKLHISYKNQCSESQNFPAESSVWHNGIHSDGLSRIIKAVSLAQYRLTVPFIGLIRVLNKENLDANQLQKLIQNAIKFLKMNFSEWKKLDFNSRDLQRLLFSKRILASPNSIRSTEDMFQSLVVCIDPNKFPSQAILKLFDSWQDSITTSRPGSDDHIDFQIVKIPSVSVKHLIHYVQQILDDHCPSTNKK